MKRLVLISILALAGCQHPQHNAPKASTAAVGVNLDNLGQSLNRAQDSVNGVRTNLSAVDAKAVRIQEAIRHW